VHIAVGQVMVEGRQVGTGLQLLARRVASSWDGAGVATLRDGAGGNVAGSGVSLGAAMRGDLVATLRDGAGSSASWRGETVPCKMVINSCRALVWLSLRGTKGEFGDGCCRVWAMSAMPALM